MTAPKRPALKLEAEEQAVADEIRALAAADLPDFAKRALSAANLDNPELIAQLAEEIDAPNLRVRMVQITRPQLKRGWPKQAQAVAWRDAYPYAFKAAVNATHDPLRTLSFIHKESAFDHDAISPAHAVGLMQLLPRTAQLLGGGEVDLFDPAENIRLGDLYLSKLDALYGGQLPLIAAAYNAGPNVTTAWFKGKATMSTDLFIEMIPFKETRNYVKWLSQTLIRYRMIHEGMSLNQAAEVIPTSLDLTIRPGVNF
ncbi:lytic transglycosylase domain-containing protein [Myxococcota bacterium]|nr:lytic transglycosylase domain-containing protein [Myxococcota bacterium]